MQKELAEVNHYEELLARIGSGLDRFLTFEHPDALSAGLTWRETLDQPLPQTGVGVEAVTDVMLESVIPYGTAIIRPGFTGFITTGCTTAPVLAMTAANVASGQRYTLSSFNFLEELSLDWLAEMLGIVGMKGVYSSGGSVANLIALGGARQYAFEAIGVDPAASGVNRQVAVYASAECHHTILRSCGVLGVGRNAVRLIDCDPIGRMNVEALRAAIATDRRDGILPMAIVANAGTTDTGAIDPLRALGEIAQREKIWFHVDGAYGLPGILDDRIAGAFDGLELADSVIVDPHKWLGSPVGVSATFVKDREILARAFTQEPAHYLEGNVETTSDEPTVAHSLDGFGIPYFDYGVELSAPCRGVAVWASILEIGLEGMRARVKRHNDMARTVAELAKGHERLELLREPELSICCFRYVPKKTNDINRFNHVLQRRLVRENVFLPSTTQVGDALAIRPCFVGARTGEGQAEGLVDSVLRIGAALEAEG